MKIITKKLSYQISRNLFDDGWYDMFLQIKSNQYEKLYSKLWFSVWVIINLAPNNNE